MNESASISDQPQLGERRMTRKIWLFAAFLLFLLCIYFWSVIFGGQVLAPTDMIFQFPFFKTATPPDFEHPDNPLLSDPVLKFYPWHTAVREALQSGQFPFWNPYVYSGAPLFANGESAILYPINVLGYLLPLNTALALSAILRMLIAGLGTYLFLGALHVGAFGALVAALAFTFGGSMVVWLNYPVGNAYAWLPLLFFLGERLVTRHKLYYVPLTGIVIAIQILGGHYQTTFITLAAWSLYCLYRLVTRRPDRRQVIGILISLAGAVALGVMLVAVQLLPFWEWLQQSSEVQRRVEEGSVALISPTFWKEIPLLATLVLPNLFGNPTWGSPTSFFYSNYIEQMVYVGIVPLSLAMVAFLTAKLTQQAPNHEMTQKKRTTFFLAGLGLLFLGLALELPGLGLINRLPLFNVVAPNRYRLVFTFCVTVLAGIGAERLFRLPKDAPVWRYLSWGLLGLVGVGAAVLLVVRLALVYLKDTVTAYERIRDLYPLMVKAFSLSTVEMYAPLLVALAFAALILFHRHQRLTARWMMAGCVGLLLVDLFIFGIDFNPAIPPTQTFPESEAAQFLQNRLKEGALSRIVALKDNLPPNTGMPYKFSEIAGVDFPSQRYAELAEAAGGHMQGHFRISFSALHPQVIDLMNVQYVVAGTNDTNPTIQTLREVYQDAHVKIYENPDYLPRVFLVHQALILQKDAQILETLAAPNFDPLRQVILEKAPPASPSEQPLSDDETVQLLDYQPQKVVLQVTMTAPGLLFLSDAYYPGWQAWVNGEETEIYRANYDYRAIYLPPGKHHVRFTYTPTNFKLGLGITLVGLFLTTALLGASWIRAYKSRKNQ